MPVLLTCLLPATFAVLRMNITLLSDLGMRDPSTATAKAVLMSHAPGAAIMDISHNVSPFDVRQAAYLLRTAYRHFPRPTVHVIAVDIFGGDAPKLLLAEHEGYSFICPDNGLLQLAFQNEVTAVQLGYPLERPYTFAQWLSKAANILEAITNGQTQTFAPHTLQPLTRRLQLTPLGIDCNILYVDRFDNVVLDITKQEFDEAVKNRTFSIRIMRMQDITVISNHYNEAPEGEPLCRFNSAGYMEIAVNHGSAASFVGVDATNPAGVRHAKVKIFLR